MSRTTTKIIIRRQNGEVVSQHALGVGEHLIGRDEAVPILVNGTEHYLWPTKFAVRNPAITICVSLEKINQQPGCRIRRILLVWPWPLGEGRETQSYCYNDQPHECDTLI